MTWSKLAPSPHTVGPLDVQELSQKLAIIPAGTEEEGEEEGAESQETGSSVAAVYGSEGGMCRWWALPLHHYDLLYLEL